MKLSFLFMFTALLTMHANNSYSQRTKITLNLDNVSVARLLDEIESKTDFRFVYQTRDVDLNRKISIKGEKEKVTSILDRIFQNTQTTYQIIDKQVFLKDFFRTSSERIKDRSDNENTQKSQFQVSGTITDENGMPLPGANIVEKGTLNGVTSDFDGNYSIQVANGNTSLEISYIGFVSQTVSVNGQTSISVTLIPDSGQLDEVVVTALGITKAEKTLGFAVQKVDAESLTEVTSSNWTSGLNGKVAGLNLTKTSSMAGSTRVVLRGESSLNFANNQALFVVDGIPITNHITPNSNKGAYTSEIDFGNGINDLNPEDIESVSVLKGPSAAALYGSRAANGVVMITTKSGANRKKGLGVGLSSTLLMESVNRWPDYQYEYGAGGVGNDDYYSYVSSDDGPSTANAGYNFGPKLNQGQEYVQYGTYKGANGELIKTPWVSHPDNIKSFFKTGVTDTKSVSLAGNNDKGNFRLSYTNMKKTGIIPNNGLDRNSFSLNTSYQFNEKLNVQVVANYINSSSDNISATGYSANTGVMYFFIWQERNLDLNLLKDYWVKGKEGIEQSNIFTWANNPYFTVNEVLNGFDKDRLIGSIKSAYKFNAKFELTVRGGTDFSYDGRTFRGPFSTVRYPYGFFRSQRIKSREDNFDFLMDYKDELGEDFNISFSVGGNILKQSFDLQEAFAEELAIPMVYSLGNSRSRPKSTAYSTNKKVNSLYAFGQLSFRDQVYLDFTGRNDWSSTLPTDNNSFFYPSVSSSILLGEMLRLPADGPFSFAKLRLSWARVGNDTSPYQLEKYYNYGTLGGSVTNPSTLPNADLEPEITTSYEVGTNLRFLNNRINFDFTTYYASSRNQILNVPVDISSGFSSAIKNAGRIVNRGIEISLRATPIKSLNGFSWSVFGNWATNKNEVKELGDDIDVYQLAAVPGGVVEARVGESFGNIYGQKFRRAPGGEIVYFNGVAQLTEDLELVGNISPDWTAGVGSQFSYKNFSLNILFNGKKGGDVLSLSHGVMSDSGGLRNTVAYRDEDGVIGEGVKLDNNGNYVPNDVKSDAASYWRGIYQRFNAETNTFDTSYIKLGEVRLGYNFPSSLFKSTFLNEASIALVGRDLFIWTKWPLWDPDASDLNGGTITPGIERAQRPSVRSIGVNVNVKF